MNHDISLNELIVLNIRTKYYKYHGLSSMGRRVKLLRIFVVYPMMHSERALALARLVADGAGKELAGVLVDVPDVIAKVVLPREPLEAGRAVQV